MANLHPRSCGDDRAGAFELHGVIALAIIVASIVEALDKEAAAQLLAVFEGQFIFVERARQGMGADGRFGVAGQKDTSSAHRNRAGACP